MAEEEGSSSVGADGLYSRAAYVDTPAIPDYQTLHDNTPAVQQIKDLYWDNRWDFTKWHMALFYMTSKDHLADLAENPEAAREYGNGAELFRALFNFGRIPASYKLRAPHASAAVNLAPPSASVTFDISAGASKSRDANEATQDRLKRKSSVISLTGTLKKKATDFMKRSETLRSLRRSSSSSDSSPHPSTNTGTGPPAPTAPLDKGKRPVTRSAAAAAAARMPHDTNQINSAQRGETARHEGSHQKAPACMHSSDVPPAIHKRRKFEEVQKRDRQGCVVTHKAKPFEGAHIVPFAVNSTEAGLGYLPPALAIAERLLGESFGQTIRRNLDTLGGTDRPFNIITLTPYLHRLWDAYGFIGFRPCYIDAEQDKSGKTLYFATFTFHWLFKNALDGDVDLGKNITAHDCYMMVEESTEFAAEKDRYFETVYTPGREPQRLQDGHVCRVEFEDRRLAERMMVMLDLRWHASRLLRLSGRAGDDFLKLDPNDDDSDSDGYYLVFDEEASRGVWGSDY
ncbi:uncharacterized protein BBA_07949 [Beauveria bassiana ARSEF 2860]|uniref:HNH nuclease domain-containing protein n=1 Tax=Beauveria bassiana (strain ARSEF 2860) TaxID=655819 RepID=J4KM11_BEAB2|nr:uncharacterized protein BBA_07949 [Beauveria bassiana ARSEF 2860]EJP63144.1 hypothetical protein BBA_07949 [Beauveria bassiana ARSEF 2860]